MRTRARQPDAAAALRVQIDAIDGKPVSERKRKGALVASRGLKHDLQVGPLETGTTANEGVGLEHIAGQGAAAIERVLKEVPRTARQRSYRDAVTLRVARLHQHPYGEMIMEIAADAGQVVLDLDAVFAQLLTISHSRQHQHLWRLD